MTLNIVSAQFGEGGTVYLSTADRGDVAVTSDEYQSLLAAWVAAGGVIAPYEAPPAPPPELSREAFCVALIGAGILSEAQASAAALGEWPAEFEPALANKTLVEKLAAKNLWQRITVVPRDAPLFLDLLAYYAGAAGLNDAQAAALGDQIFAGASNG